MKILVATSLVALGLGTLPIGVASAEDLGDRIGRGIVRGVQGDVDHPGRRRHWEGREGYGGGGCRTIIVHRETPDGDVTKRIHRCD
jgi:hypothetical protein